MAEIASFQAALDKQKNKGGGEPPSNDNAEEPFNKYAIFTDYQDEPFEVEGWLMISAEVVVVSKGKNALQFVVPFSAFKYAEVQDA
jgi:hypothetical protein